MKSMMKRVFVLQHTHEFPGDSEDVKFIGVYSSRSKAREAVGRLGIEPGFRDSIDGFAICEYSLDEDYWSDGFVTT